MRKRWILRSGEAPQALSRYRSASVHAIITDPPAGIGYQNREWDGDLKLQRIRVRDELAERFREKLTPANDFDAGLQSGRIEEALRTAQEVYGAYVPHPWVVWLTAVFYEYRRILKPGGWCVIWTHVRTKHRVKQALELSGFDVVDEIAQLHGTGFPKSVNVDVAVDRHFGHPRNSLKPPLTATAAEWVGAETALKPSREDWVVARRPREGTIAETALKHGTGTIDTGATRIQGADGYSRGPSHTVLSEDAALAMPARARRFYFCSKPLGKEREAGLDAYPETFPLTSGHEQTLRKANTVGLDNPRAGSGRRTERRNVHPTVKSIDWCRFLVKTFTRKNQIVADFFMGSGSTGCAAIIEGRRFRGLDMDPLYVKMARARIRYWSKQDVEPLRITSYEEKK